MMHWWEHYNFRSEPFLDASPLTEVDDLNLFLGWAEELRSIDMRTDTKNKICLLITGAPGIGKTTFLCKAFQKEKGFIRVNLSKARNIDEADAEIARSCAAVLKRRKIKAVDLDRRMKLSTSRTTGRTLQATPGGAGISSISQKTETSERNYEIEDIIKTSCERLSAKSNRIVLTLDESDFLGAESPDNLSTLCQRMKELIPNPGALILVNRDARDEFDQAFADTTSLVRSTFDHYECLKPLWRPGEGKVKVLLDPRFRRGNPSKSFVFPLAKEACF